MFIRAHDGRWPLTLMAPDEGAGGGGDGGAQEGAGSGADKTFTQADLDKIVQDRLGRERSKFADYDDLKAKASRLAQLEDASKSDLERLTGERDALHGELSTLKGEKSTLAADNLRLRIAMEKEIPADLIDFLSGESREDIEKKADALLARITPGTGFDSGARGTADGGADMNTLLRQAAGRA